MSTSKIKKQLIREIQAYPKRAAVLAIVSGIALYMWAPLAWRLLNRQSDKQGFVATTPLAATTQPIAVQSVETRKLNWEDIAQAIESDPLMRAASDVSLGANPFVAASGSESENDEPTTKEVQSEPGTSQGQESAGLELTSTIVGLVRSTAIINGKAYSEGKTVRANVDGTEIEWVLLEIHDRRVVLLGNGRALELTMAPPKLLPTDVER